MGRGLEDTFKVPSGVPHNSLTSYPYVDFSTCLIEHKYFPMLDSFAPNPALKVEGIDLV